MVSERRKTEQYPVNGVRVCIDRCSNYDVEGRMYSKLQKGPMKFRNCGEMLLKADYMFDEKGFPQTFQRRRCFTEEAKPARHVWPDACMNDRDILEQSGNFQTFDVIVRSRKKSSWQGILKKKDGTAAAEFKSEMQLLSWIWNTVLDEETVNSH